EADQGYTGAPVVDSIGGERHPEEQEDEPEAVAELEAGGAHGVFTLPRARGFGGQAGGGSSGGSWGHVQADLRCPAFRGLSGLQRAPAGGWAWYRGGAIPLRRGEHARKRRGGRSQW